MRRISAGLASHRVTPSTAHYLSIPQRGEILQLRVDTTFSILLLVWPRTISHPFSPPSPHRRSPNLRLFKHISVKCRRIASPTSPPSNDLVNQRHSRRKPPGGFCSGELRDGSRWGSSFQTRKSPSHHLRSSRAAATTGLRPSYRPGGNPGANLKSISPRCHPILVAFVWELTKETIDLHLDCLQRVVSQFHVPVACQM